MPTTMTVKKLRRSVWVWACRCARCGHSWTSTAKEKPSRCASCKALAFNKPARPYRRKRPRRSPKKP